MKIGSQTVAMTSLRLAAAATGLALGLVGCGQLPRLATECGEVQAIDLPVVMVGKAAIVPVLINGKPARLLLDTGADLTNINVTAASRLGLPQDLGRKRSSHTAAGEMQDTISEIKSLRLGWAELPAMPVAITAEAPVDGVLGLDVLKRFDVDFDLGHTRLTLHPGGLCVGQQPPWKGELQQLAARRSVAVRAADGSVSPLPYLMLTARLNDVATPAMLDSGALFAGLVHPALAVRLNLDAAELARDPGATANAFGTSTPLRLHRFDSLRVGLEVTPRPVLAVGGSADAFPLVLGMDFFLTHRIWLGFTTDRIFLQPYRP